MHEPKPIDSLPNTHDLASSFPGADPILAPRFGIHRGVSMPGILPNSLQAIERAIQRCPPFVEFDVQLAPDGTLRTGHPPQPPMDPFEAVLRLFERQPTYPKIDLKLRDTSEDLAMIDAALECVQRCDLASVLFNLGGSGTPVSFMRAERHFCQHVPHDGRWRLNIDLARYRTKGPGRPFVSPIAEQHVAAHAAWIRSISPEIRREDWEKTAEFCQQHGIPLIGFWVGGWPNDPQVRLRPDTVFRALALEEAYPGIQVLFDIHPDAVEF